MAENKTKPTNVSVESFLAKQTSPVRREDCNTLLSIMKTVSKAEPKMWGPSIVGFGDYHYSYASGREGDICLLGFSPRAAALTIYVMSGFDAHQDLLARLGKFKTSVACLYVKKLSDIDLDVLEEMLKRTVKLVRDQKGPSARAATTKEPKPSAKKAGTSKKVASAKPTSKKSVPPKASTGATKKAKSTKTARTR